MNKKVKYMLIGAVVGAILGSSMGIAAFGGAIAGTLPVGVLGGLAGWQLGKWRNSR
ncbi:MAG: hypothetical protein OXU70_12360 [Gammaproteobacteria bacterium]|nr:hypothetical protein [Gammaproteobacteria bacterium]